MTKRLTLITCATPAIAAVLSLTPTSLYAQDAGAASPVSPAPSVTAPVATAPADPAPARPTIVLPDVSTSPQAATPPQANATSETPTPARTATTSRSGRPARVAQSPVPVERVEAAGPASAVPANAAPIVAPAPVVAEVPPAQPVTASPAASANDGSEENSILTLGLLGLVVAVGGGAALALARRRRTMSAEEETAYRETFEPEAAIAPVVATTVEPAVLPTPNFAAAAPGAPALVGDVVVPQTEIEPVRHVTTYSDDHDRSAIIERMVAAEPDAENPFRSIPKRRKRARMILAARERAGQDVSLEPGFDFRNYRSSSDVGHAEHTSVDA